MRFALLSFVLIVLVSNVQSQKTNCAVIAYYADDNKRLDSFNIEGLTHIIFSFCHLQGNKMYVSNAGDSATIKHMVQLKKRNPSLKVILSLGGWSGCETCSSVFEIAKAREEFAASVKNLLQYFKADGIDLDWEYPAIVGFPGHRFVQDDKQHFTSVIQQLRNTLGNTYELSFAAGGFANYFDSSVEWKTVMPLVNRVNLMSYDLVNGYATTTGNHTPLYSTPQQNLSVDYGVRYLDSIGVPLHKITIGAAFYARIFEYVDSTNHGMYQSTRFKEGVSYKNFNTRLSPAAGFVYYWDDVAKAPYMYNAKEKLFVSFDDTTSIRYKTQYAIDRKLDGIMFWQLGDDAYSNGLLHTINEVKTAANKN